jgi:hypothetical protein
VADDIADTKVKMDSSDVLTAERNFDKLKRTTGAVTKTALSLRKAMLATSAALTAGAGAMFAFASKTAKAGDNIAKTADKLGLTVEALQETRYAAERAGVQTRVFDMAMQRMARRVAEAAQGSGEAKSALEELGLSAKQLSTLTPDKMLAQVADAMQGVTNSSDRVRLAFKLFDAQGASMVNMLRGGSQGLQELRQEAIATGAIMSDSTARQAEVFQDRMLDVSMAARGVTFAFGGLLMPMFNDVVLPTVARLLISLQQLIDRLATIGPVVVEVAGAFVAAVGVRMTAALVTRYGPALVATITSTNLLTAATGLLTKGVRVAKLAMLSFAPTAIITALLYLGVQIVKVKQALGSWGETFNTIREIAVEFGLRVTEALRYLAGAGYTAAQQMQVGFYRFMSRVLERAETFVTDMINGSRTLANGFIDKMQPVADFFAKLFSGIADNFNRLFGRINEMNVNQLTAKIQALEANLASKEGRRPQVRARLQRELAEAKAARQQAQAEGRIDSSGFGINLDVIRPQPIDGVDLGSAAMGAAHKDIQSRMRSSIAINEDRYKKLGRPLESLERLRKLLRDAAEEEVELGEVSLETGSKIEEAMQAAGDAVEQVETNADKVAGTLRDGVGRSLKSLVEGTTTVKQAFRDLAKDVIDQLWDIIVTQRIVGQWSATDGGTGIVGGIMKLFGFADGGAFSGGRVVPFASGGVFNSPTTFPMSGGTVGMLGEAGPEAIMPLTRGPGGRLGVQASGDNGSNGAVHVTQNFNFTANGDETVKQIIRDEAPAIAQMTRNTILSERRRGGQFKTVFG